jgi:predicted membrane protein
VWNKIRKPLMVILLVQAIVYLVGRLLEKKMTVGDEGSDDFQVAAICNGKEFHSRAQHLKTGSVVAGMGGIDLDLRDASLDPEGATIELNALMGGIELTVPEDWAIDIDAETMAGDFEANVTPIENLPEDAPKLHIHAVTRIGSALVTTET